MSVIKALMRLWYISRITEKTINSLYNQCHFVEENNTWLFYKDIRYRIFTQKENSLAHSYIYNAKCISYDITDSPSTLAINPWKTKTSKQNINKSCTSNKGLITDSLNSDCTHTMMNIYYLSYTYIGA